MFNNFEKIDALRQLNLRNYKEMSDIVNFSCPICGDSKKSSTKARGVVLGINSKNTRYFCHNCQISLSFTDFLKQVAYYVYENYIKQVKKNTLKNFKDKINKKIKIKKQEVEATELTVEEFYHPDIVSIANLPNDHLAKKYLLKRAIPNTHFKNIYYFKGNPYKLFTNMFDSNKYEEKSNINIEHEGIILPRIDNNNKPVGFTLRRISGEGNLRYLNLSEDDNNFFYNEHNVNFKNQRTIYILEGQFDLLSFSDTSNLMAMCSINRKVKLLEKYKNNKFVYVMDNEYNNENVVKAMKGVIKNGHGLFIWPNTIEEKDINDIKKNKDWSDKEMIRFFEENTYFGTMARIKLKKKLIHLRESLILK